MLSHRGSGPVHSLFVESAPIPLFVSVPHFFFLIVLEFTPLAYRKDSRLLKSVQNQDNKTDSCQRPCYLCLQSRMTWLLTICFLETTLPMLRYLTSTGLGLSSSSRTFDHSCVVVALRDVRLTVTLRGKSHQRCHRPTHPCGKTNAVPPLVCSRSDDSRPRCSSVYYDVF